MVNNLVTMFNEYDIQQAKIYRRSTLLICYTVNGKGGFYFEDMNQPDSALIYHKMAYQDRFLYFGENHPETSKSINNLGLLFQKYSEYNSAEAYFSKAISSMKNISNASKQLEVALLFWVIKIRVKPVGKAAGAGTGAAYVAVYTPVSVLCTPLSREVV